MQLVVKQDTLDEQHKTNQCNLDAKLKKLEQAQEEAIECAIRRTKRDCPTDFKKRGHWEQFEFNQELQSSGGLTQCCSQEDEEASSVRCQ